METLSRAIFENKSISQIKDQGQEGLFPALVTGLSPIHMANLAAGIFLENGRRMVVLCPDEAACLAMAADIRSFTGAPVLVAGSRDFIFYSSEGVSRQEEHGRVFALDKMARGDFSIIVAPVSGFLQKTVPPERLRQAAFTVSAGGSRGPDEIELGLLECGYTKTGQVEGVGQYARRGGILDMFSPAHSHPVRCEFWGDEIDTMGLFETDSQRRVENVREYRILPAAEVLPSFFEKGGPGLSNKIEEIRVRLQKNKPKKGKAKLLSTLGEDAERLRQTQSLPSADRYLGLIRPGPVTAFDYLPEETILFLAEPSKTAEKARAHIKELSDDIKALQSSGILYGGASDFCLDWTTAREKLASFPLVMADSFTRGRYPVEPRSLFGLKAKQLPSYAGSIETAVSDVRHYLHSGYRVVVLAGDERRCALMQGIFSENGISAGLQAHIQKLPDKGSCVISVGNLSAGFEYPEAKIALLSEKQLSGREGRRGKKKKARTNRQRLGSYTDLSAGDLVVHEHHGIGRFAGIYKMPVEGVEKDYVKIKYAGTDSLYVPATQLDLVSKYIGGGEERPVRLSKMGGTDWTRAKTRAKGAARDLAKGLIALYSQRQHLEGHAFAPDSPWQTEFEGRFEYNETEDQLRCIAEIKEDMEKRAPMDRLLCGDVGYGKTEVALRAVMKCVLDGKQAALLVPTTVLAQQHYQTSAQRFFGYPIKIESLSRFKTPAQIRQVLQGLQNGSVDFVIGTHRLLQKDVGFKDLGLLIVDEEQRFGVSHKERLKEISRQVDVLTLSATPIPRTLNMALSGIRDMSTIEEPPEDRLPVQTYVMEHDWVVVCDAIRREMSRGGQVYYLHNRIDNIERTAIRISDMLDNVSVAVAHGQMDEESLSLVMERMALGEIQVLVCTTIIETGIDIPNVNTLIIEDADRLGLAQLHQIRGRVGRSSRRAAAYLTFRKNKQLSEIAEKRLSAIREFVEFNSGFKIAMRDLEIRGAGDILGAEQSGHMITVGYDMYLKLLEEAVLEERGEAPPVRAECSADLSVSANIPESYVPSPEQRMDLYRRIALIRTQEDADDLTDELIDRFGDPPASVNALVHVALLRGEATNAGISDIVQKAGFLRFTLTRFNMEQVSATYNLPKYKGRVKVEAGQVPCLSLRLQSTKQIIRQARDFVNAYSSLEPAADERKEPKKCTEC